MAHKLTVIDNVKKSVYQFRETWNEAEIKQAVKEAGDKGIPLFELAKIELQPVKICDRDCLWCFGRYLRNPEKEGSRLPAGDTYLPLEAIVNNVFIPLNRREINPVLMLAGLYSDPLAYPHADRLMRAVGIHGFRFGLYTNGTGLKDVVIEEIVNAANDREGKPSYVSLDISAMMAVGEFEKIYPKIVKLVKAGKKANRGLLVNAPVVLNDFVNWNEPIPLETVHKMLIDAGVDAIRYNFAIAPINPKQQIMIDRVLKIEQSSPDLTKFDTKAHNHCYVLTQSLSIHSSGDVYPCSQTCSTTFKHLVFGNVKQDSILDIWQGEKHREMFQRFDPSKSFCRCNVGDSAFNTFCAGGKASL